MPIKCPGGLEPRFRFRDVKGGKQRLAFCGNEVVEIVNFLNGKKRSYP